MPPTRLSEEQIRHIEPLVVIYLDNHPSISNTELRALAAIRYDQATYFFNRMLEEGKLLRACLKSLAMSVFGEVAIPFSSIEAP